MHPFGRFSAAGLRLTVNTDNPGYFETDVSTEEALLLEYAEDPSRMDSWLQAARRLSMDTTAMSIEGGTDWAQYAAPS